VTEVLKLLSLVTDGRLVDLSQGIRREIADREAEERKFREADQEFWKHPEHDPQANAEYEKRRQRLVSLRTQLRELYKELMTLR
jgi:Lon protease-like protein